MKLLRVRRQIGAFAKGVIATIGNFDGLHLGHQHLINTLKAKATRLNLPVLVILFEPQAREYFQKERAPARISSLREKLDILKMLHVDYVYCIKFDKKLAEMSAYDFARDYLFSGLKVKYLLVGEDFRFGKNREGQVDLLRELGACYDCEVESAPDFLVANEKVSSTKIRHFLADGLLTLAKDYLGRPYSICGRVIYGAGRGRQWGIPTANLGCSRRTPPLQGVFVSQVLLNSRKFQGVVNVGIRPTVDGMKNSIEVHLFDFDEPIYGKLMQVFFLAKLRDEIKFTSPDELISQIHKDIAVAKNFFTKKFINE